MKEFSGICCSCQKLVKLTLGHMNKPCEEFGRGYHYIIGICKLCGDVVESEEIDELNKQAYKKMKDGSEFYDYIGGYHSEGEGWDPNGDYCGECGKASCADCYAWLQGKIYK
jgi:hypothetical protein